MKVIPKKVMTSNIMTAVMAHREIHVEDPEKIILTAEEWDKLLEEIKDKYNKFEIEKLIFSEYWKEENKEHRNVLLFGIPIEPERKRVYGRI